MDKLLYTHLKNLDELNWKQAVGTGLVAASLLTGGPNASGEPKTKSSTVQTLGQRNNNPINLKAFSNWEGMTGKDKYGHAIFSSLEYGIRAGLKNLKNAFNRRPEQTLVDYMNRFAEENGTSQAKFIAKELGVSIDTKLKDLDFVDVFISLSKTESRTHLDKQEVLRVKEKYNL
jgi:hypothetical protein